MSLIRVDQFAGVPLFYDRFNKTSYGEQAVPMRPYVDSAFSELCEAGFKTMVEILAEGGFNITQIWSGGVGRAGSGSSYHHKNRAFDLDALIFSDGTKWVADTFPERPFIYLAIESALRMNFGTVLNYDYNKAHEDHFHFDNGTSVKFKRDARSHVIFLQHTLEKLFNQNIGGAGADGVYGPDTDAALTRTRKELGIGGLTTKDNWLKYLATSAKAAAFNENAIVSN